MSIATFPAELVSIRINKDIAKRKQISDDIPALNQLPVFPHVWFEEHITVQQNQNKIYHKPPLKIPDMPNGWNLMKVRSMVYQGIMQGTLQINLAKLYLYELLETEKVELKKRWTSWNRVIGDVNAEVGISNIMDVKRETVTIDGSENETDVPDKHDKWMPLFITGIHRITNIERDDYRQKVSEAGNKLLLRHKAPQFAKFDTVVEKYDDWNKDTWYPVFMAAIDMFLANTNNHKYTQLRFGTIINRFRDSTAVMDVILLHDVTGLEFSEIARWLWIKRLANELDNCLKRNEEIDKYNSYTPYFMGMDLSPKSPYGVIFNQNLHFWTHIVSITLGNKRSINARLIGTPDMANLPGSAMIFAYVLLNILNLKMQYSETGEVEEDEEFTSLIDQLKSADNASELPSEFNAEIWLGYIKDHGNKIPENIKMFCLKIWHQISKPREGTIGEFMLDEAIKVLGKQKELVDDL